ncbi:MAG: heme lyase CcmF/NrfE family subunit, partial [Nitrospinota bacterium]
MIIELGEYALILASLVALYSIIVPILGLYSNSDSLLQSGAYGLIGTFILLSITTLALLFAILTGDYSIEYVYGYSNIDLSFLYKISSFWAGQKGSLLLWGWMLALFSVIAVLQNRNHNKELMPYVTIILAIGQLFFTLLIIFPAPLFEKMTVLPEDGYGLNPLLQNPGMVYHPPTLYIGFVGFMIPFAFAMASLCSKSRSQQWIVSTRRWTIFAWLFLTIGNLLGANWAYVELGWGGYWGWDPVENASLMPWLTGTAYLHSIMIQERKKMLKTWNMVLISLTFILTILGTFITRSGIISSVHAFGESSVGTYFLYFLIFIVIAVSYLIFSRHELLRSEDTLDSLVSRESSFIFNNIILVGGAFTVLAGTMFPLVSELFIAEKVTVGPLFFNKVMVPIGLGLLLLAGICPLIAWRKASVANFKKNFLTPIGFGIFIFILSLTILPFSLMASLSFGLSGFVLGSIFIDLFKATKVRHLLSNNNYIHSLFGLIWQNKRKYGGYIVHIGAVFLFIGFTGSAFNRSVETSLFPGDKIIAGDYDLTFVRFDQIKDNRLTERLVSTFLVEKNGKPLGYMRPEIKIHFKNSLSGERS